ncbi:MAG TPA: serine/threonine phosphatase, partial [Candidatus Obscuribacterales bacterium]
MVVCPQCQFENPSLNKFCQSCGSSLTQKYCPECGATVAFNTLECSNCGTTTGTVYRAVVIPLALVPSHPEPLPESLNNDHLEGADTAAESVSDRIDTQPPAPENPELSDSLPSPLELEEEIFSPTDIEAITIAPQDALSTIPEPPPQDIQFLELPVGAYLDPQERYQLLEPLPPLQLGQALSVKVLDTQPLQVSPLKVLEQQSSTPPDQQLETFIIADAQPYFSLASSEHSQYFPRLQDAWEQSFYRVILLEDFADFPLLSDLWSNKKTTPKQIVDWLGDLVKLWELLEPWGCRQSLLDPQNLRVFPQDSQQLCLKQLYFDPPNSTLDLSNLGLLWQELFQQSQRTLVGSLTEILRDLIEGKIPTVAQLQKNLMVVLDEINSPSTAYPRPKDPTLNQAPTLIPVQRLKSLEAVGRTDVGRQRDHNEDCFGMATQIKLEETPRGQTHSVRGLYILCDGMGGHAGGEIASQMAVDTLKDYFQNQYPEGLPPEEILRDAILQANEAIYTENQKGVRSGVGRMGTTLVMALVVDHQVVVAHVGDSRLYRLTRT